MRTGNVLFSAVHFFVFLLILSVGGFLIALSKMLSLRFLLSQCISDHYSLFLPIGIALMAFAGILFAGLYAMNRKRYYTVKMQCHKTGIDEALIQKYVEKYWKEKFPHHALSIGVILLPHQKIEVVAEIPPNSEEEQIEILAGVEKELGGIFAQQLGFKKDFTMTLSLKN